MAWGGQRKEVSHVILQDHCILHDLHFTVATLSLYFLREREREREQTQVLELSKSKAGRHCGGWEGSATSMEGSPRT